MILRRNPNIGCTLFWGLLLLAAPLPSQEKTPTTPAWVNDRKINASGLEFWVNTLASPGMTGREAGTPGYNLAAKFITDKLTAWKLPPPEKAPKYHQEFSLNYLDLGKEQKLVIAGKTQKLYDNFVPRTDSTNGKAAGIVVDVGLGVIIPEIKLDCLAGKDLQGKIALINRSGWRETMTKIRKLPPAKRRALYTRLFRSGAYMKDLAAKGAIGLISFSTPPTNRPVRPGSARTGYRYRDPSGRLTFFKGVRPSYNRPNILPGIQVTHIIGQQLAGKMVSFSVHLLRDTRKTANVVATWPGTDPKGKVIILGANLDSRGKTTINGKPAAFLGANYNASGCAALLEIARVFSLTKPQLKHTVAFVFWSGRRKGLAGSRHYITKPLFPLAGTMAVINLDRIGKPSPEDNIDTFTSFAPPKNCIAPTLTKIARAQGLALSVKEQMARFTGDHWPFYDKKIPVANIHCISGWGGAQEVDPPSGINLPHLQRITRVTLATIQRLAKGK